MFTDFIRLSKIEREELKEFLDALDNDTRIVILEMLEKQLRDNAKRYRSINYYTLNIDEIDKKLRSDDLKIKISQVAIREHCNQLMDVGLVGRIKSKTDSKGNRLPTEVYSYYFNMAMFDSFFFENQLFLEEIQSYMRLYAENLEYKKDYDCVISVFTGINKGEVLKLNKDQRGYIGRDSCYPPDKYGPESLLLSPDYETVNKRHEPHLEIFYEDGEWFMIDNSTHGTFSYGKEIEKGKPVKLENDSFIQLSRGPKSVVLYVSYNEPT